MKRLQLETLQGTSYLATTAMDLSAPELLLPSNMRPDMPNPTGVNLDMRVETDEHVVKPSTNTMSHTYLVSFRYH